MRNSDLWIHKEALFDYWGWYKWYTHFETVWYDEERNGWCEPLLLSQETSCFKIWIYWQTSDHKMMELEKKKTPRRPLSLSLSHLQTTSHFQQLIIGSWYRLVWLSSWQGFCFFLILLFFFFEDKTDEEGTYPYCGQRARTQNSLSRVRTRNLSKKANHLPDELRLKLLFLVDICLVYLGSTFLYIF